DDGGSALVRGVRRQGRDPGRGRRPVPGLLHTAEGAALLGSGAAPPGRVSAYGAANVGQRVPVSSPEAAGATGAGGSAAGRSSRSSAPPRAERATVARPPWASTTRCTIDSPRPDPGNARALSAR